MSDDHAHEGSAAIDLSRRKRAASARERDASRRPARTGRHGVARRFARHPLARAGMLMFACVAMCAVFADALASDLPLACRWHGTVYLAPWITRPTALGQAGCASLRATQWRGDWLVAPLVEHGPRMTDSSIGPLARPGTPGHPLGTDALGRDVFARLVHGARTTLTVGIGATTLLVALGVGLGAIAGFAGGAIDGIVARAVEALTAIPSLVLAIVVSGLHPSSVTLFWTLGLTRWTELARVVRAEVISTERTDFVLATRALGASPVRVFLSHILPNALSSAIVAAAFGVASFVAAEASVDFLLGLRAASDAAPSWAEMMAEARGHPRAWWLVALPAGSLLTVLVSFHLVGEAARSVLDPGLGGHGEGSSGRARGRGRRGTRRVG